MNQPLDQVSGSILIRGRSYSAKEIIRGLLEQGIAINDKSEGLRIGFKLISPESNSNHSTMGASNTTGCPFIPHMNQITEKLNILTNLINPSNSRSSDSSSSDPPFSHPPSDDSPPPFSPFSAKPFSPTNDPEEIFSSGTTHSDDNRKCSSCGSILPTNAFFCNKCGSHIRSG